MKTVIETQAFLTSAREAGMPDTLRQFIVDTIAADPMMGDLSLARAAAASHALPGAARAKAAAIAPYILTVPMTCRCCC